MKGIFILAVTFIVSGCTAFTSPMQQPVIEEKLGRSFIDDTNAIGTLSLTPERRVVLSNFSKGKFCAEAPTEVGIDISQLIEAPAKAKDGTGKEIGLGAVVASAYSNSVLNRRTQGVQLFQTNAYFLCQMYMNDAISKEQLIRAHLQLLNTASQIIMAELPLMYKQQEGGPREMLGLNDLIDIEKVLTGQGQSETDQPSDQEPKDPAEATPAEDAEEK